MINLSYHICEKKSIKKGRVLYAPYKESLLAEGHAVGALIHGGITLVGAYQNAIQSAVVSILTVVSTLMHGAFNALVCLAIHN